MNKQSQNPKNINNIGAEDKITLKDIILKFQEWSSFIRPLRFRIIIFSLSVGFIAAIYAKFLTKPTYTASYKLFFQDESVGVSGAMRLASSFGLSMGGGSSSSSAAIQEYLTSRRNIAKAITTELENGPLIDRFYHEYKQENERFAQEFKAKFKYNQRYTDSILTEVFIAMNEGFVSSSFQEETRVLVFNVTSEDEEFTYDLANLLVTNTEKQFQDWKRQKSLSAVNAFQRKVDSLKLALDDKLLSLGEFQDQNNSLISAVDNMEQVRLSIDMESLKVAYGEYIKGLEMSKAELMNLEPPFKYFDAPTYPLQKVTDSAIKSGIIGSLVTGFLMLLLSIVSLEGKNIMAN